MSLLNLYNENRNCYLDTDKEYPNHKYISECYSDLFYDYCYRPVKLLEIGLGAGGSLLLWHDYFELGKIYGIDIGIDPRFEQCKENVKPYQDITLIQSDAYDPELVKTLPNFDIIIDDGPHTYDSHIKFLNLYLPKLNSGGVMIIEDIMDINYIQEYIKTIPHEIVPKYEYKTIDTDRSIEYNNLLFLVKKL